MQALSQLQTLSIILIILSFLLDALGFLFRNHSDSHLVFDVPGITGNALVITLLGIGHVLRLLSPSCGSDLRCYHHHHHPLAETFNFW